MRTRGPVRPPIIPDSRKPTVSVGFRFRRKSASELVQRLRAAVQRNDAAGEILPADVLPTIGDPQAGSSDQPRADGSARPDTDRVRADYPPPRAARASGTLYTVADGDDRRRKLRDRKLATGCTGHLPQPAGSPQITDRIPIVTASSIIRERQVQASAQIIGTSRWDPARSMPSEKSAATQYAPDSASSSVDTPVPASKIRTLSPARGPGGAHPGRSWLKLAPYS